jgi:hypothetical protein
MMKVSQNSAYTSEDEDDQTATYRMRTNPRLISIKQMLWETCKLTNESGLRVTELESILKHMNRVCHNKAAYGDLIL